MSSVSQVQSDQWDLRGRRGRKDLRGRRDLRDHKDLRVRTDRKGPTVNRGRRGFKGQTAPRERPGLPAIRYAR